ncbi:MAG: hypothetical protein P8M78_04040 [Myxococcota bacterium]|nr:hypothetical protein [Myxococcota bacterium]
MTGRKARSSAPSAAVPKATVYEVRCPSCDVSFPPETRRCLHCGGRTDARSGFSRAARPPALDESTDLASISLGTDVDGQPIRTHPLVEASEEESTTRGGWARSALTLLWVAAAIGFSVLRACQEG